MAIQGAGKPGNQVNQGAALGAPYNPNNSMQGAPDFAGQAMSMIQWMMAAFSPPKVETKKETKAEKTEEKAKKDEVKNSEENVATSDVEDPTPSPTAADARRMVADADALGMAMNTGSPYVPQFYGRTTEVDNVVSDEHKFGADLGKIEGTSLHFDKESEPST